MNCKIKILPSYLSITMCLIMDQSYFHHHQWFYLTSHLSLWTISFRACPFWMRWNRRSTLIFLLILVHQRHWNKIDGFQGSINKTCQDAPLVCLFLRKVSNPYFHQGVLNNLHEYLCEPISFPPLQARNARKHWI